MNRFFATLAAASLVAASVPSLGFAEEASTTDTTATESSASNDWKRPCDALTGLRKAQCIVKHNPGRGNKKDRLERRANERSLQATSACKDKEGTERLQCLREQGKKPVKAMIRNAVKRIMKRTIRGKLEEGTSGQ